MSKRILQLGGGSLMLHSIRKIQSMGHKVFVTDFNPKAPGFSISDGYAAIDLKDIDGTLEYAKSIQADAVLAVNDAGVRTAAVVSEQLGLIGVPEEVAINATDKGKMREVWRTADVKQPNFRIISDPQELKSAVLDFGFPSILKPCFNWGSRGISKIYSEKDVDWAIQFAIENCRDNRFIIEEKVKGIEMTIEGLVQNGEVELLATSDKIAQAHEKFCVAMALNYPAFFSEKVYQKVENLVKKAIKALNISNGAIHAECMIDGEDVNIIELGVRPGGGHIFGVIVEAVSGVSMPQALVNILLGKKTDFKKKQNKGCCYRFFAPPEGIFRSVEGIDEVRSHPAVLDIGFSLKSGTLVGPIEGDADRPGFLVTSENTRNEAVNTGNQLLDTLTFNMK